MNRKDVREKVYNYLRVISSGQPYCVVSPTVGIITNTIMEAYEKGKRDTKKVVFIKKTGSPSNISDRAKAKYWLKRAEYWQTKIDAEFTRRV